MNLQLANTGRPFSIRCVGCGNRFIAGNKPSGTAVYADLDGLPFTDYYCALCAGDARAAERVRASTQMTNCSHGSPNSRDCRECKADGVI